MQNKQKVKKVQVCIIRSLLARCSLLLLDRTRLFLLSSLSPSLPSTLVYYPPSSVCLSPYLVSSPRDCLCHCYLVFFVSRVLPPCFNLLFSRLALCMLSYLLLCCLVVYGVVFFLLLCLCCAVLCGVVLCSVVWSCVVPSCLVLCFPIFSVLRCVAFCCVVLSCVVLLMLCLVLFLFIFVDLYFGLSWSSLVVFLSCPRTLSCLDFWILSWPCLVVLVLFLPP
jgi:hypothetical protein